MPRRALDQQFPADRLPRALLATYPQIRGFLLALAALLLCGCRASEALADLATVVSNLFVLIASFCWVLISIMWTADKFGDLWRKRAAARQSAAKPPPPDALADWAILFALGREWPQAQQALAVLPFDDRRDRLVIAIDLLRRRSDALDLLYRWEVRLEHPDESSADQPVGAREALLGAMSELAEALQVQISEQLCRHPSGVTGCCNTCGADFRADGREGGRT